MPSPSPTTIYDLIAAHAAADARFEASCDPSDEVAALKRGGAVTPAAARENEEAGDAEQAALMALLAHVPGNLIGLRRQVGYLQYLLVGRDAFDEVELGMLLNSLAMFDPPLSAV